MEPNKFSGESSGKQNGSRSHMGANGSSLGGNGNGTYGNGILSSSDEEDQNDPFDPQEILFSLWDGKWIILACVILLGSGGYFYTQTIPDEFETSGIFLIESQRADRGLNLFEFTRSRSLTWNEIGAEMQFIRNSTELGENVGRRLLEQPISPVTGDTLPVLLRAGFGRFNEEQVVQRLGRILPNTVRLTQIQEMNLINISSRSTDRYEAAQLINLYMEEYGRIDSEVTRANLNAAADYLNDLERERQDVLISQDEELRRFLQRDWSLLTDQDGSRAANELRSIFRQIDEQQFELEQHIDYLQRLESERDMVLGLLADGVEELGLEDWLRTLNQAILQLEIEAEEYYIERPELRENPDMSIELSNINRRLERLYELRDERLRLRRDQFVDMQGLDNAALTQYLTEIRRDIRIYESRILDLNSRNEFIEERLTELQGDLLNTMNQSAELARMRRNMRINEDLYVSLLRRLQETQIAIRSEASRIREIRPASIPGSPVSPNRTRNYLLSLILGFGLGAGFVLLRKMLDDMIHDPEQLRKAGFNVLGVVPDLNEYTKTHFKGQKKVPVLGNSVDVNLVTLIDPLAAGSEAYRRLKSNIEYSRADKKTQTIVMASSKPAEGKSLTAMNLALTYAQFGIKTILIDADLRKPTVHKLFNVKRSPGLSDVIFDKANLETTITPTGVENFSILTCGTAIPSPAETLGSLRMQKLIDDLRSRFEIIVIDTPPLQVVSDAVPLAVEADATILVCRADETEFDILKGTRRDMKEIGVTIVGTVLNGFDYTKGQTYYKYNYKYKYNYAYKTYRISYSDIDKT
ncbi:MAG: polysaccharide biosynthesis tyrosine autokinase [Balneolales bacterium]|nr:polysaccharide biosynthesis tyrosine autokinase [Balneolales bacterium]